MSASLPEAFLYNQKIEDSRRQIITSAVSGEYGRTLQIFHEGVLAKKRNGHDVRQDVQVGELSVAYGLATLKRALCSGVGAKTSVTLAERVDTVITDATEELYPYITGEGSPYVEGVQPMTAQWVTYRVLGRMAMVRGLSSLAKEIATCKVVDGKTVIPWAPDKHAAIGAAYALLEHTGSMGRGDRAMVARVGYTAANLMERKQERALWRRRQGLTRIPQGGEGRLFQQVLDRTIVLGITGWA